jgi:hypothetical protein
VGSGTVTLFSFAVCERATVYELPLEQLRVRHPPHVTTAGRPLRRSRGTASAAAPPAYAAVEIVDAPGIKTQSVSGCGSLASDVSMRQTPNTLLSSVQ